VQVLDIGLAIKKRHSSLALVSEFSSKLLQKRELLSALAVTSEKSLTLLCMLDSLSAMATDDHRDTAKENLLLIEKSTLLLGKN